MTDTTPVLAWHFLHPNNTLRDGRPAPADGVTLTQTGPIVPCENGLHASVRASDALEYHPGQSECGICRVELGGTIVGREDDNKLASSERRILWRLDGATTDAVLHDFARWSALQVIHRWDAPDVVRQFLTTGDGSLRNAAEDAAWTAAWATAGDAVWDAARVAAGDATRAAAWAAARDAAGDAAWYVARVAAQAAAWVAARDAARDAAWAAVRDAQNAELERRFNEAYERSVTA